MDAELIQKLKNTELEILLLIDDYCNTNNIEYSLFAGTALGAVRHGGFIPWDDDVDIIMTRIEFDKFYKAWLKSPIDGLYLDSIISNEYCGTSHAKVRKNDTLILSEGEDATKGHHGIWVDIFILDIIPIDKKHKKKSLNIGKKIVLLSRANVKMNNDSLGKRLVRFMITVIPKKTRMDLLNKYYNILLNIDIEFKDRALGWKNMSTLWAIKNNDYIFDLGSNIKYSKIGFENFRFPIFEKYDHMLSICFGNYMELPPESERVLKHSPIIIEV